MRVVNSLHAVFHQRFDFVRGNRPSTAAENLDMTRIRFAQPIYHVTKELVMAALIGTNGYTIRILLDRRPHNVVHTAVMAEVNDLGALCLNEASHDIDGGVVAVE